MRPYAEFYANPTKKTWVPLSEGMEKQHSSQDAAAEGIGCLARDGHHVEVAKSLAPLAPLRFEGQGALSQDTKAAVVGGH